MLNIKINFLGDKAGQQLAASQSLNNADQVDDGYIWRYHPLIRWGGEENLKHTNSVAQAAQLQINPSKPDNNLQFISSRKKDKYTVVTKYWKNSSVGEYLEAYEHE
jgi:hypothetical protein